MVSVTHLHEELHDVGLVAFQGQTKVGHFHDVVEKIEELGDLLEVKCGQLDDALDLLRQDLETRDLVADKRLTENSTSISESAPQTYRYIF